MVFFNCNACGEALKKNAVEKHYMTKCRQCEVVSCADCGKDFWGNEYQEHTKCFSEEEKYSGKNYKPKPNANKGERKQELWLEQVQAAVQKSSGNGPLTCILQKLADYPNIPRKQAKFENFLKNSLRIFNQSLSRQVWEAMADSMSKELEPNHNRPTQSVESVNKSEQESINPCDADESKKKSTKGKHSSVDESTKNGDCQQAASDESNKQKNKRERKEERSKKTTKKQKKDKNVDNNTNGGNEEKSGKRKRLKHEDHPEEIEMKKSKKDTTVEMVEVPCAVVSQEVAALTPSKFKWESTIVRLLKSADDKELAVKKLRKKVINEYFSLVGEKNRMTEDQVRAKLDKKMNKNARFKVHKERVKLIS